MKKSPERMRRIVVAVAVMLGLALAALVPDVQDRFAADTAPIDSYPEAIQSEQIELASEALAGLEVKGRAPKTDYAREQFGAGWATVDGCDMRNTILQRDLVELQLDENGCTVLSGTLNDPYTGTTIAFQRGPGTSAKVQIDHIVALSDAWQKGAQQLDVADRTQFANDPLNLLAVDGPANQQKSDADAASWLPLDRAYRCRFVARQIAVKQEYNLWVTKAEHDAMKRVLTTCPTQPLPVQIIE